MTGKELTSRENEHLEELLVAKQTAFEQKESQKKRLENLKITRDGFRLQELRDKSEQLNANLAENERQVSALKQDMNRKKVSMIIWVIWKTENSYPRIRRSSIISYRIPGQTVRK